MSEDLLLFSIEDRARTDFMDTMVNIARVARAREAIGLLNNLIAVVGLCAFGIPVTRATITSTLAGWALIGVAGMQLCLKHLGSSQTRNS